MICRITQERFRQLFRPPRWEPSSMAEATAARIAEIEWWYDSERNRLGTVIYDGPDNDWQAIMLEYSSEDNNYHACVVEVSMPTQKIASAKLQELLARPVDRRCVTSRVCDD